MSSITSTSDDDQDPLLARVRTSTIVAELHRRGLTGEVEARAAEPGIELRRKPVRRRALSRLLGGSGE